MLSTSEIRPIPVFELISCKEPGDHDTLIENNDESHSIQIHKKYKYMIWSIHPVACKEKMPRSDKKLKPAAA